MSKSLCKQRVAQSICHVNQEAVVCVLGGEGKESSAASPIPCHVWCSPHTPSPVGVEDLGSEVPLLSRCLSANTSACRCLIQALQLFHTNLLLKW